MKCDTCGAEMRAPAGAKSARCAACVKREPTGIEAQVAAKITCKIAERQDQGMCEYGMTLEDNPMGLVEALEAALEESLDLPAYLLKSIEEAEKLEAENERLRTFHNSVVEASRIQPKADAAKEVFRLVVMEREGITEEDIADTDPDLSIHNPG